MVVCVCTIIQTLHCFINNENYDIDIAMSSSHADSELGLGLNILSYWAVF